MGVSLAWEEGLRCLWIACWMAATFIWWSVRADRLLPVGVPDCIGGGQRKHPSTKDLESFHYRAMCSNAGYQGAGQPNLYRGRPEKNSATREQADFQGACRLVQERTRGGSHRAFDSADQDRPPHQKSPVRYRSPGLHSKPIFPGESGLLAQFSMVTIDASRAVSCSGTARHRDFRQLPFSNVSAVHTDWWCPPFAQHFVRDFLVRGVFKNVYKAEKSRPTK